MKGEAHPNLYKTNSSDLMEILLSQLTTIMDFHQSWPLWRPQRKLPYPPTMADNLRECDICLVDGTLGLAYISFPILQKAIHPSLGKERVAVHTMDWKWFPINCSL